MADTSGQADIRGIDVEKAVKGFADEELILKKYVNVTPTSAREIRWYQKTSGFLTATTTSASSAPIANVAPLALPNVVEQSWTRQTSYVRKYFVESPVMSMEDIRDSDVDVLMTNIRDLVRAIAYQVESRIWDVLTESRSVSQINTNASTAAWDAGSGQDPIEDIMEAKMNIREDGYNPEGAVLLLSPKDHKSLLTWLISTKGSAVPNWSSERVKDGVVMELLGCKVVVSTIVTADYALLFTKDAATWKEFVPITSATIEEKGIGTKVRVWEEGECILHDPKACNLITNTQT